MTFFDTPLDRATGSKRFAKANFLTVRDLLNYVPRSIHQVGELTRIEQLPDGADVTVVALVSDVRSRRTRTGQGWVVEVSLTDTSDYLVAAFFPKRRYHFDALLRDFKPGQTGLFSGKVRTYQGNKQLTHPAYRMIREGEDVGQAYEEERHPEVVYRKVGTIESWHFASAVKQLLAPLNAADVPELVPVAVRQAEGMQDPLSMYQHLHAPDTTAEFERARDNLRFQEAFVLQVELVRRRTQAQESTTRPRPIRQDGLLQAFDANSPFTLTAQQSQVGQTIAAELSSSTPMMRLLQGDVGTGKTLVALRAMLQVVDSGGQAALLAPTEVLANQHYRNISGLLGPLGAADTLSGRWDGTKVSLLTASLPAAKRRQALADIASGSAGIVVGTHALLGESVSFGDLGLVVVDEQHRFGVEQRDIMRARSAHPVHSMIMTATPIPRTVAMTVFGDLEVSTLSERPAGGAGSDTFLVGAAHTRFMDRVWERCREAVDANERVYVVCPRIDQQQATAADEEGDLLPDTDQARTHVTSVMEMAAFLRGRAEFRGVGIGVLHSRMSPDAKDAAMAAFVSGDTPVLVATTVIEVGVDVPAATRMVIMDADRFGLSQLHQLRGRVGRGTRRGLCFAVSGTLDSAPAELQGRHPEKVRLVGVPGAVARLQVFASTTDGFRLAEEDLRLRREGDVLGAQQHGSGSSLMVLRVVEDTDVIVRARAHAVALLTRDPELTTVPDLSAELARLERLRLTDYLEMS